MLSFLDALKVLLALRRDEIVVTTMGAAREWPKLSRHPLDFHYVPSAMGEAPALGLGLALARPNREVIVLNGDGGMLMNLGSLVTIVASRVRNITLVLFDNGIYEVTGGQQTAAAAARHAKIDYAGFARAAGFLTVRHYDDLPTWQREAPEALTQPGPRFISLAVEPVADWELKPPGPMHERIKEFQAALAAV